MSIRLLAMFVALFIFGAASVTAGWYFYQEKTATEHIEKLKSKAAERLNDPASAQFQKLKLVNNNKILCGEINAKNKLGGYAGYSAFAANQDGEVIILKVMTLEVAAKSDDELKESGQILMMEGKHAQLASFIEDMVYKKRFAHWKKCLS